MDASQTHFREATIGTPEQVCLLTQWRGFLLTYRVQSRGCSVERGLTVDWEIAQHDKKPCSHGDGSGFLTISYHWLFFFCLFAISWAAPAAYGGSQAKGPIGTVATGLCQSHSNSGSEPRLQPTPQLTATLDR